MNPVNNMRGEEWETCDRCGYLYPMSKLRRQLGLLLCTVIPCTDDLSNLEERRARIIAEKLKRPEGVPTQHIAVFADPGELVF